ncbi:unnamed protein product [Effrenium voratum]|nr:unnamed protein product [Effrenium voratum]
MAKRLPWLFGMAFAKCGDDLEACQTDIELGRAFQSTLAPTQLPGRASAKCADWPGCSGLGLFGDCCPSGNTMLGCCSASRRLASETMSRKGLTVDDTTLQYCAGRIPQTWPNFQAPLGSLRIFQAWNTAWPEEGREASWKGLAGFARANGVKILVGTPVTCEPAQDEKTWGWTKEFLRLLDPSHVMGLAIGNELELLYDHADQSCIKELWEGKRLWKIFQQRVAEFDEMGFKEIPVTSVFTAAILSGNPFTDVPGQALVNTFLRQALWKYKRRYAFTFNVYPYFDPNLHMNAGSSSDCSEAMARAVCWEGPQCLANAIMVAARHKMQQLTGRSEDLFWIGEIGWSSPRAQALHTDMRSCGAFSSLSTFEKFYSGFLKWDLTLPGGVRGPDHVFYFTLRDALNFGVQEFFGLLLSCESLGCKIATGDFRAETCALPTPKEFTWRSWAFVGLGLMAALAIALTCLYVRFPSVQRLVRWAERPSTRRKTAEMSSESSSE